MQHAWFLERFGIDFSNGTVDPNTGIVVTDFGVLVPYTTGGYNRVLSSNNPKIPAYTPITPSTVGQALYTAVFFTTPTYAGTFVNGGPAVVGHVNDTLSYACSRIFLNYAGNKFYTFFARSYYPQFNAPVPAGQPPKATDWVQMYSADFGPGFQIITDCEMDFANQPNPNGKFDAWTLTSMCFPGSFLGSTNDWNGFTTAPFTP